MTLTDAVFVIKRMQEKALVGNIPDIATFTHLD